MQEASGALLTAESQASQKWQELLDLQRKHEANIQSAVGKATVQYQERLSSATQSLQAKDRAVQNYKIRHVPWKYLWQARQTYLL